MPIKIDNKTARHLFIHKHGLSQNPASACTHHDIQSTIEGLGFVQVDSIRTVERAHHLIIFSRHQTYKHLMLERLLENDRTLFENWTHDASIIPSKFYPFWKHLFAAKKITLVGRWKKWGRTGFIEIADDVMAHIKQNPGTFARDLKPPPDKSKTTPGWWDWHPSKSAFEYLWRSGQVAICHRKGFQKAYDLVERVIPSKNLQADVTDAEFQQWACTSALERLGFASHGEIAAFWALVSPAIVKTWIDENPSKLRQVEIQSHDKKSSKILWANSNILDELASLPKPPSRLRILSPFDPMLRDRKRAKFLFGFDFRVEMFVPEPQRIYGYYVFPILQGDKIIGRIDMKADRKAKILNIRKVWLEDKIKWSAARKNALEKELTRIAKFTDLLTIAFEKNAF